MVPRSVQVFWVIDGRPPSALRGLLEGFPGSKIQRCDSTWRWPRWTATSQRVDVVRLSAAKDLARAVRSTAELLLSDSPGKLGGSGVLASRTLSRKLATRRRILLAGGLTPDNVSDAIADVQPFGVDVASGVESAPGHKDRKKMEQFVRRARASE
jgi:phosphoribosylanthranilate isomerase